MVVLLLNHEVLLVLLLLKVKVATECLTSTRNRFPSVKISQIHTSFMFLSELLKKYDISIFQQLA